MLVTIHKPNDYCGTGSRCYTPWPEKTRIEITPHPKGRINMKLSTYLLCERNRITRRPDFNSIFRVSDTTKYAALDSIKRRDFRREVVGRWAAVTLVENIESLKKVIL